MQVQQEWMTFFVGDEEHPFFRLGTFDFIVLDDELLLKNLDGVKLLRGFGFSKHDFSKVSFSKNSKEVEMIEPDSLFLLRLLLNFRRLGNELLLLLLLLL